MYKPKYPDYIQEKGVYVCMFTQMLMHSYTLIHSSNSYSYTLHSYTLHSYTHILIYSYTYTLIHSYTHTHAYTHTHTHTYIPTHIHTYRGKDIPFRPMLVA